MDQALHGHYYYTKNLYNFWCDAEFEYDPFYYKYIQNKVKIKIKIHYIIKESMKKSFVTTRTRHRTAGVCDEELIM